ncbi:MAG TPA: sugar ABC transporter permease [Thermomicrobiales bacterium]|jgi:multiple sugar transport system permease protein|nr:sugar ABC transporter permease [Thermomicrobiales bacterium]
MVASKNIPGAAGPGDNPVRKNRLSIRTREAIECYLFILPAILGLLLFYLGPMIASFVLSLTDYDLLTSPEFIGFENYRELVEDELFWQSLRVTAIYSIVSVPVVLALGLFLAVLLNQHVPGTTFFRAVFYLPTIISGVAVAMLWRWIFNTDYGILNLLLDKVGIRGPGWLTDDRFALTSLIITSIWTFGGAMLIFLAGLQGIPSELYEAAELDGAGRWRRFWTVTFPLLSNVTFFNLVLGIIGALQVFTEAFVLTNGGPNNATLLLPVYLYRNAFSYLEMGYASAIAWVMFLIVFILTLIVFRSAPLWVHYQSEGDDR